MNFTFSQPIDDTLVLDEPVIDLCLSPFLTPGFASNMMIELLNMQLAIELARFFRNMPDRFTGGLPPWRLRMIDDRIGQFGSTPTLEELAGLVGLSVRQLTRGFWNSRGISIGAYVEEQRAEEARRLLRTGLSIKELHGGWDLPPLRGSPTLSAKPRAKPHGTFDQVVLRLQPTRDMLARREVTESSVIRVQPMRAGRT